MYDFDQVIERRGTDCVKWDILQTMEGGDQVTPMWVADMDFEVAPGILKEMQKEMDKKIFGYRITSPRYEKSVISWMKRRHQFEIQKEWICFLPNVVSGLYFALEAVSEPGDEILIQTPVYGPFHQVVKDSGRILLTSPMKNENGYYTMDLEDFESRITEKTKAAILCNPHNPCGRVWTREELLAYAQVCQKHHLIMISDDIHFDLVYPGHPHTVLASLSPEIADACITLTSPSKPFNVAGMHVANAIISNEALRTRFTATLQHAHMNGGNSFAEPIVVGAYEESEQWLDELLVYLNGNLDLFVNYIQEKIPRLTVRKPEGTYLVWVDCRKLSMTQKELNDFFFHVCRIYVNEGLFFGAEGEGFVRFNLACPRSYLLPVLERMREEIDRR